MKKIVYFIILSLVIFSSKAAYADEYNQENTIQKAILIEDYIKKHKIRIEEFIEKYEISDTSYLQNDIKVLDESIKALNKIKNSEIKNEKSEEIIQAILKRIKLINEELKEKLNYEKLNFEKRLKTKKDIYSSLWVKISKKIDEVNIKIAKNLFKDTQVLSLKESRVKEHLIKLNNESKKLKYFWNINFKSEKEIKDSFVRILNNIKREVSLMNSSLK